jgi:hypothetical protein
MVKVRLAGSCVGCPSSSVTLRNGVENMLMHYIPEVKGIEDMTGTEGGGGGGSGGDGEEELKLAFKPSEVSAAEAEEEAKTWTPTEFVPVSSKAAESRVL